MKKALVVSTGTELLLGTTVDTNSIYLSERLEDIGIKTVVKSIVGDQRESLQRTFRQGLEWADIIISSGGLGPTRDDLTKEAVCDVLRLDMEIRKEELVNLKDFFAVRSREMPECNVKQAMFPREAEVLHNSVGTAPGMYIEFDGKIVVLLPGPPWEMKSMYVSEVEPRLIKKYNLSKNHVVRKTIKLIGIGESQIEQLLPSITDDTDGCSLALLAEAGEVHIKITSEGTNTGDSQQMVKIIARRIEEKLGNYIYGYDNDSLSSVVAGLLQEQQKTVSLAESCTGGLLSKLLTDVAGSSGYFWGSVISYSNEAKRKVLGVKGKTLSLYGAVSEETAIEMAEGIMKLAATDLGIGITGIAGPGGGSETKPVGLVYIGVAGKQHTGVQCFKFIGSRTTIRTLAAKFALDLLRKELLRGDTI